MHAFIALLRIIYDSKMNLFLSYKCTHTGKQCDSLVKSKFTCQHTHRDYTQNIRVVCDDLLRILYLFLFYIFLPSLYL